MIALAGTVGLIMTVIFLTRMFGSAKRIPVALLIAIALIEVGIIYYYMGSLEAPGPAL